MSYRLIALDIDGTVVDGTNAISPAVAEAISAARSAGLTVVLSTGRGVPGTVEVAERLAIDDDLAVSSNGAIVFAYDPFELVHTVTFDAAPVVRRIVEQLPDVMVGVEEIGVGFRVSRPFPEGEISGRISVEPVEDLIAEPSTRVVIRSPDHDAEDFARVVEDLGLHGTNYFIGYTAWLDLAPEGVSKASGLEVVCERHGVTADEVLAVGDGRNDVEMLRWAGRGVAMGQAPPEVCEAADAVTGSVEQDGLATELHRWL